MGTKLTPDDMFNLSQAFHKLSNVLGDYRFANWNALTSEQRDDLEAKEWTLFNTSSDLNAKSVVLKAELLNDQLETIKDCTKKMQDVTQDIASAKKAIAIAAKAVAFGGAIYVTASTGDVALLAAAAKSLIQEIIE